jgi:hypothetical protein
MLPEGVAAGATDGKETSACETYRGIRLSTELLTLAGESSRPLSEDEGDEVGRGERPAAGLIAAVVELPVPAGCRRRRSDDIQTIGSCDWVHSPLTDTTSTHHGHSHKHVERKSAMYHCSSQTDFRITLSKLVYVLV